MAHGTLSDEMAGYRPVSGWAVASLIAGVGSAAVLFTPLAMVVPLVAVAMAVAALRDLRRGAGRTTGRPLALAGLALAVGFAAQAAAAAFTARVIAGQRAAAAATVWLDAVREDRLTDAAGLCNPLIMPGRGRPPAPEPSPEEQRQAFAALPVVRAVAACGRTAPVVIETRPAQLGGSAWLVRADVAACGGSAAVVRLVVEPRAVRRRDGSFERWLVQEMTVEP
jgi:hypothetical protein